MNTSAFSVRRPYGRAFIVGVFGVCGSLIATAAPGHVRQVSARNFSSRFAETVPVADPLRPAERAFLNKAVEVTRQQLKLAEIGTAQTESAALRSYAMQLSTDYRQLNEALGALQRRKGGLALAPVPTEKAPKPPEGTGAAFEREYVRIAAQATDEAVTLFEQGASDSKDTDLREFAAAQLPMLRAHRSTIADLKKTLD